MTLSASILGCSGLALLPEEKAFFKEAKPWGFILFKRNIDHPDQVLALTDALQELSGRADTPILIDQEGGRVQRLGPPHWPVYPSGRFYGRLYEADPEKGLEIARLGARLMAHDLRSLGITVDCLPVLDVPRRGAHDVIGDRAYGEDPDIVAALGRAAAEGLLAGGVLPVIKHIPGHGRAGADSHEALPVVEATRQDLEDKDFAPFHKLADLPLAMTAHVVYTAIDRDSPATTSKRVMQEIVRGHIGYDGLVMSDDLSMKALSGSFGHRTEAAFQAGCDVALHCNGKLDEMKAIAEATPLLSGKSMIRAQKALALIEHEPEPLDVEAGRARLEDARHFGDFAA